VLADVTDEVQVYPHRFERPLPVDLVEGVLVASGDDRLEREILGRLDDEEIGGDVCVLAVVADLGVDIGDDVSGAQRAVGMDSIDPLPQLRDGVAFERLVGPYVHARVAEELAKTVPVGGVHTPRVAKEKPLDVTNVAALAGHDPPLSYGFSRLLISMMPRAASSSWRNCSGLGSSKRGRSTSMRRPPTWAACSCASGGSSSPAR